VISTDLSLLRFNKLQALISKKSVIFTSNKFFISINTLHSNSYSRIPDATVLHTWNNFHFSFSNINFFLLSFHIINHISYFFYLTSYFPCLTSCFSCLTSYFLSLTSNFLSLTSYFLYLTSRFLYLTSYFLCLTSCFFYLTSCFLCLISYYF